MTADAYLCTDLFAKKIVDCFSNDGISMQCATHINALWVAPSSNALSHHRVLRPNMFGEIFFFSVYTLLVFCLAALCVKNTKA